MFGMTGNQTAVVVILVALIVSVAIVNVVEHIASVRKARWEAFATNVKNGQSEEATPDNLSADAIPPLGIVSTDGWIGPRRPIRDNPQA